MVSRIFEFIVGWLVAPGMLALDMSMDNEIW
jgi:hypothetical protein